MRRRSNALTPGRSGRRLPLEAGRSTAGERRAPDVRAECACECCASRLPLRPRLESRRARRRRVGHATVQQVPALGGHVGGHVGGVGRVVERRVEAEVAGTARRRDERQEARQRERARRRHGRRGRAKKRSNFKRKNSQKTSDRKKSYRCHAPPPAAARCRRVTTRRRCSR